VRAVAELVEEDAGLHREVEAAAALPQIVVAIRAHHEAAIHDADRDRGAAEAREAVVRGPRADHVGVD
jgi:hypothetical protein